MNQHLGRMVKILQKMFEETGPKREFLEELQYVVKAKNWHHIAELLQKVIISSFPPSYRLF